MRRDPRGPHDTSHHRHGGMIESDEAAVEQNRAGQGRAEQSRTRAERDGAARRRETRHSRQSPRLDMAWYGMEGDRRTGRGWAALIKVLC